MILQNSPIGVIAAASANPAGFLNDVAAYGEQLHRALARLRAGDTHAYRRSITARAAQLNLDRWRTFQEVKTSGALLIVSACGWCNSAKGTKTLQELGLSRPSLPSAAR